MWQLPPLTPEEILLYLRKSQSDDPLLTVEETLSKHEQMLDEWVEQHLPGLGKVPEENRFREVVSGETIESRPRVQELLREIESPRHKAILIVEPQRLSRGDLEDIGRLVKLLRYSNTLVITLQYTYDLRDERDRDMFERELKRGNEFLEYQKRIMSNGRLLAVQNGNFIGNTAPYGYKKIQIKEGKKKCFTLEPDPSAAPIVKLIFELYRDGLGATRISDKLNEMHAPVPKGKTWSPNTIPNILSNEHYLGKVVWNRRKTVRTVEDGKVVESRPHAEDYLVYEGKHPALIDQALWDAVQERRGKIPPNGKAKNFENPLAGIVFCKTCGKAMTRRTYNHKGSSEERSAPRLCCNNQRACASASALFSEVLAEVVKVLREAIADFEIRIEAGTDNSADIHRQMVERLEKRLTELQELEIAQWDEKTKGGMPAHVFERLNRQTLQEMEEVHQALCTAKDSVPEPVDLESKLTNFRAALDALENPAAPAKEKNNLLKLCIDRIEYSRERSEGTASVRHKPIHLDFTLRV